MEADCQDVTFIVKKKSMFFAPESYIESLRKIADGFLNFEAEVSRISDRSKSIFNWVLRNAGIVRVFL